MFQAILDMFKKEGKIILKKKEKTVLSVFSYFLGHIQTVVTVVQTQITTLQAKTQARQEFSSAVIESEEKKKQLTDAFYLLQAENQAAEAKLRAEVQALRDERIKASTNGKWQLFC